MKDKRLTQTILILITLLLLTNSIHALSIKNEITIKEANDYIIESFASTFNREYSGILDVKNLN